MITVKILSHSTNALKTCTAAANGCYSKKSSAEIFETLTNEQAENILKNVIKRGHESVIEHANYTFSISGVSRSLTHQLVRHRMASYSQQSQRYVTYDNIDFVTPKSIKNNITAHEKFVNYIKDASKLYTELIEKGIAAEDARFVLPNATCTAITVTMNARELLHFFKLRTCTKAQWEIREMAEKMLTEVQKISPIIFEKAGPRCISERRCLEAEPCGRLQTQYLYDRL